MMKNPLLRTACLLLATLGGGAAPAEDPPLRVEPITDPLPFYDAETLQVREPKEGDTFPPMRVLLSRSRYWADDGHLDVVVRLNPAALEGDVASSVVSVAISDAAGRVVASGDIEPPHANFIFHPPIPDAIGPGDRGRVELTWRGAGGAVIDRAADTFRVERFEASRPAAATGAVPITVANGAGVVGRAIPMSVGVPFPRGVLHDGAQVRLVAADEAGRREIPVQVSELARWSKFGSLKWLRLDFVVDLEGKPRTLALEYGQDIRRTETPSAVEVVLGGEAEAVRVDLGRVRLGDGLWYDPAGDGSYRQILRADALDGAFVQHADGRLFRATGDAPFDVEEAGPLKVVLRREGWYVGENAGDAFCRYITRYVLYKDSPLIQIFHSWIFTGDGNKDGIANMGWRFPLASGLEFEGFPRSFDVDADQLVGRSLLQWDYEHFDVLDGAGGVREFAGERAPGVALFRGDGVALGFGTRDFWQNYPSELEVDGGTFWFHNWPRHNRPAGYTFEGELAATAGEPAKPSAARHREYQPGRLSRSEWTLNLLQARFAHEGEVLSFRLPDQAAEDPIVARMRAGRPWDKYWRKGEPESINAQGISRTEEMWLAVAPAGDAEAIRRTLRGLNEQTLRAVVDPAWIAASDALYEIHEQDWERFPQEEQAFEQLALAPGRWQEHLGLYGMWIYGDITGWDLGLDRREPALYRAYRKRHHGWPYSWIPYARSGDARLLRLADAATRQNIDANWRHYATDGRRTGLIHRSTLPWAATIGDNENATRTRDYESKVDYLLHAWYIGGYHRAWDLLHDWMALTRRDDEGTLRGPIAIRGPWGSPPDSRFPLTMLKSYVETYEATFDPWFLVAAHEIARGFDREFAEDPDFVGTHYVTAYREFHRFTGSERWKSHYLRYVDKVGENSLNSYVDPLIEPHAYAWKLTGNPYHLGRLKHLVDWMTAAVWLGDEPAVYRGFFLRDGGGHTAPRTTGWMLQYFPLALRALTDADETPTPIAEQLELHVGASEILVQKSGSRPISLPLRQVFRPKGNGAEVEYELTGPDGFDPVRKRWDSGAQFQIPADAPEGVYRLRVGGGSLVVPVSDDHTLPEAIHLEPGQPVKLRGYHIQSWFYVPAGLERFSLELSLTDRPQVRRVSVWSPDGRCVWDFNYHRGKDPSSDRHTAEILVPPGQDGKLWRITLPAGGDATFTLDERIPPFFAIDRNKWFMLAEASR